MNYTYTLSLFLISFLFFPVTVLSQEINIDSLKHHLSIHSKKDSVRVNLLNSLADFYLKKDSVKTALYISEAETLSKLINYQKGKAKSLIIKGKIERTRFHFDKGIKYINEALKLYKSLNNKKGIAECYHEKGLLFYDNGKQQHAINFQQQSIQISTTIGDTKKVAVCLNSLGKAYDDISDYTNAISCYKEALTIHEKHNYQKGIAISLNNIGTTYSNQGNYPLALELYKKSLFIDKQLTDSLEMSKTLNNIGVIYKNLENYDKAITSYTKALAIQNKKGNKKTQAEILNNIGLVYKKKHNYDKALEFLKKALDASTTIKNKAYIGVVLNNIGDVYMQLQKNATAYHYFKKGKTANLEVGNKLGLCNSYLGIATVLTRQKQYNEALVNALESHKISTELNMLTYKRDVAKLLSEIYSNTKQYKKALKKYKHFKILNDSLFNKKNIEKIAQLESEYKYKQELDAASIRELKLTKTVKTTSKHLEKSQRNYLLAIIGILVISILLGTVIFYLKYRNIKSKTQNIITEQRLLRSQMTPHFTFNALSVLQGMILNKENKKAVIYLSKFSKLLRIILENSRDKTVLLTDELKAIEHYLELHNLESEAYNYTILVDATVNTSLIRIPPMLIQPFVENIIEHAFINHNDNRIITINIKYIQKELICTITDNGSGINQNKDKKSVGKRSLSTAITSERLKILSKDFKMRGNVTIVDRQHHNAQGTRVTLIIPHKIRIT